MLLYVKKFEVVCSVLTNTLCTFKKFYYLPEEAWKLRSFFIRTGGARSTLSPAYHFASVLSRVSCFSFFSKSIKLVASSARTEEHVAPREGAHGLQEQR